MMKIIFGDLIFAELASTFIKQTFIRKIMKRKNLLHRCIFSLTLFIISYTVQAQFNQFQISLSNNTTGLPVLTYPQLFYSQFHPGLELALIRQLNQSEKNMLLLGVHAEVYHHQFVQTLIKLYPSIAYERKLNSRINAGLGLGAGYGLSFEGNRAFVKQDNGSYKKKSFFGARSQFLFTLNIGGSYALKKDITGPSLSFRFASYMQGPYVKSYVLLLPINAFQIGIQYPLNK
jgi:hypothetical protein